MSEGRLGQIVLAGERGDDSEEEGARVGDTWIGDGESEGESVDSEGEESLKHAGVFTGEEVMRTMRDKLIRLQKLYIEQFGRLGHQLKEGRRAYLAQVREEREAGLMNISIQPRESAYYSKLKALTHYHAPAGREALLAVRLREKRSLASGGKSSVVPPSPCQHHLTSTTKCGDGVVPMARYCPKHILEQTGQVLYRQCGAVTDKDDGPCEVPVPAIFSHSSCVFHVKMQQQVSRNEEDDSVYKGGEVKDAFYQIGDVDDKKVHNGQADVNIMEGMVKDEVMDVKDVVDYDGLAISDFDSKDHIKTDGVEVQLGISGQSVKRNPIGQLNMEIDDTEGHNTGQGEAQDSKMVVFSGGDIGTDCVEKGQ